MKIFSSKRINFFPRDDGMILMATALAVFVILILLSSSILYIMVNEREASTHFVVGEKARSIAMTGLERGIQQFRRTRVPPFYEDIPFGIGKYTVRFDTLRDETNTILPWTNYVMITSTGKVDDVERNIRIILSTLPHAFLFPLYSLNLGSKDDDHDDDHHPGELDLKNSIVNGDVYFRGNVESTIPVSQTVYTPSGFTADVGTVTFHPDPQPQFPYFDDSLFTALLATAATYPDGDLEFENSTLNLSDYSDNTLYVNGEIEFENVNVVGPGRIVAAKHDDDADIDIDRSIIGDGIMIVSGGEIDIDDGSVLGTGVSFPNDGVILYAGEEIEIDDSIVYGLGISTGEDDEEGLELEDSFFYGAFLAISGDIEIERSTIVGSLVTRYEFDIEDDEDDEGYISTFTRGPLPLALSVYVGLEPYIIPGSWLEY